MRIIAKDTLVLIIDFQEKLVPVMNEYEDLIRCTQILLKGFKNLNIPMIVTQQYSKGIGMTVNAIKDLIEGECEYFDKVSFSCMDDEIIAGKINGSDKKNIIICGIEAHICVLQTVIDLREQGYNVIVVEDCISSRRKNDKKYSLDRMTKEGAIITTYEAILFELTRKAGNDTFKTISKLIK